jgi:DNA end-binding protein Ku
MAPRPHWKGYLKLSFVTCPISLYPAISAAEKISFRQVNKRTGNRLRQQLVDSVTGEPIDAYDKGRGYEVGENQFVLVEDQELDASREQAKARPFINPVAAIEEEPAVAQVVPLRGKHRRPPKEEPLEEVEAPAVQPLYRGENTRTIEIERFVTASQIDPRYHEKPYYIVPRGPVAQEAFAVIRESMSGKGVAGIGRIILSSRERPIALEPMGLGLRGVTLRYPYEVRSEAEYFAEIPKLKLPDDMLQIASHIVNTMRCDFDPAMFNDRQRAAVVDLLQEKQRGLPSIECPVPSPENLISLMDALKRSLGKTAGGARSSRAEATSPLLLKPPARKPAVVRTRQAGKRSRKAS